MFLKIKNYFIDGGGDFKGLDPKQAKAGTQFYIENDAYLFYKGELVKHDEIITITETEYAAEKERFESLPKEVSDTDRINELEKENKELKNNIADLWEMVLFGGVE